MVEKIVVLYTHYYFEPSLLPVTYYRKQRRVASHLDQLLAPLLREKILRKGLELPEDDHFLKEPIFWFKKEVRTKAYRKTKQGFADLAYLKSRFHSKLINRLVA